MSQTFIYYPPKDYRLSKSAVAHGIAHLLGHRGYVGGEITPGNFVPISSSSSPGSQLTPNLGEWVAGVHDCDGGYKIEVLKVGDEIQIDTAKIDIAIATILIPEAAAAFRQAVLQRK